MTKNFFLRKDATEWRNDIHKSSSNYKDEKMFIQLAVNPLNTRATD